MEKSIGWRHTYHEAIALACPVIFAGFSQAPLSEGLLSADLNQTDDNSAIPYGTNFSLRRLD